MLPLCKEEKIGVIPWSPLAGGKLTRWEEPTARSRIDEITKSLYTATVELDRKVFERLSEVAEKEAYQGLKSHLPGCCRRNL